MIKKYEFLDDLTSDVLFKAYGKDKKELFENSALALASLMCEINKIDDLKCTFVEINGDDLEDLLFQWLNVIISNTDIYNTFFKTFKVVEISDNKLKANICGEPIKAEIGLVQVKAITYYKFGIQKVKGGYEASVSCDV